MSKWYSDSIFQKKIAFFIILVLLFLLPFHAILVTFGSSLLGSSSNFLPHASALLASWKELFIVLLGIFFCWNWIQSKKFPIQFYAFDWIFLAFFLLAIISGFLFTKDLSQIVWGLKYDFSFWVLFYLVRGFLFTEKQKECLLKMFLVSSGIVLIYGLLQYFVLPKEFLFSLGFSENISSFTPEKPLAAYHTLGGTNIQRLASTFSGPNQYGFYLIVVFAYIFTRIKEKKEKMQNIKQKMVDLFQRFFSAETPTMRLRNKFLFVSFSLLAGVSLILTFSRSAWLAVLFIALFTFFSLLQRKNRIQLLFIFCIIIVFITTSLFTVFRSFTEKTLLRAESSGGHYERSVGAMREIIVRPFGTGLGTAGPASMRNEALQTVSLPLSEIQEVEKQGLSEAVRNHIWLYDNGPQETMVFKPKNTTELKKIPALETVSPELRESVFSLWTQHFHERIAENWHLQMFQEFGWLGGILWLSLLFTFLRKLYRIKNVFSFIAFYGIVGLSIAGLFLHSFEDSSTSLTLFLIAGLAFQNKL